MTQKGFNWFNIAGFGWGLLGILSCLPAVFFLAFFDHGSGNNFQDGILLTSALSFPLVSFGMGIVVLLLGRNHKKLALVASLVPILLLLPFFLLWAVGTLTNYLTCGASTCLSNYTERKNALPAQACTASLPDFGDGLTTTGCGALTVGQMSRGQSASTAEAQNWDFTPADLRPFTITLEDDGQTCPQMRIYDVSGNLIDGFPFDNKPAPCTGSGITTHFYYFTPSQHGTYILRIVTPVTPGEYWITVE